jgi:hypothetical protein
MRETWSAAYGAQAGAVVLRHYAAQSKYPLRNLTLTGRAQSVTASAARRLRQTCDSGGSV